MLNALYHHLRNNHPVGYFLALAVAFLIIIINLITFTANNTELFDVLGAGQFKYRIIAAKETVYWNIRAWKHNNSASSIPLEKSYGFLQSVNRDGTINITFIKDDKYLIKRITLADTIITNADSLAAVVDLHKHEDAEFDLYDTGAKYPYTVIWLNNKPFNLQIITAGIATPDTTPPTNIVDRLFAEYYWKQLTD